MKKGYEKSNSFCCILCDYSTSESNEYNKHLLTSKHNNVMEKGYEKI